LLPPVTAVKVYTVDNFNHLVEKHSDNSLDDEEKGSQHKSLHSENHSKTDKASVPEEDQGDKSTERI